MPVREFTPTGISEGKTTFKKHGSAATARGFTQGSTPADDTNFAIARKQSSNYFFYRGLFIFDFSNIPASDLRGIKIIRAGLVLSDVAVSAADSGGDKMVVSHIDNPNSYGSWGSQDYSNARYSKHTSAQTLTNGADDFLFELDHPALLKQLQSTINNRMRLHLATRNYIDYAGGTPTGMNRVVFDDVDGDAPLKLRIFYRMAVAKRYASGGGRRASKSGFGGDTISAGTSGGFGEF
jgi:hypothetical protein